MFGAGLGSKYPAIDHWYGVLEDDDQCAPNHTQTTQLSPKYNPSPSEISSDTHGNKTGIRNRMIRGCKSRDPDEW
jgi:hypothetical protein